MDVLRSPHEAMACEGERVSEIGAQAPLSACGQVPAPLKGGEEKGRWRIYTTNTHTTSIATSTTWHYGRGRQRSKT